MASRLFALFIEPSPEIVVPIKGCTRERRDAEKMWGKSRLWSGDVWQWPLPILS